MMSDQSSDKDDSSSPETKLRVSFVLSPTIRSQSQRESLQLPTEPIAVPASIRKKGLSAVVNHLLGRRVPRDGEGSDSSDDDSSDDDGGAKLPAAPFDFLLNDKLLRLPLESAARKEGLSTEHALVLQYFPARPPPRKQWESKDLPDWITAMDYCGGGVLFTGGADGMLRAFSASTGGSGGGSGSGDLRQSSSVAAHTGPIKCLSAASIGGGRTLVATGSMDQTLVTHSHDPANASLDLHTACSGGHTNSITSLALTNDTNTGLCGEGNVLMASGDWDGGLAVWSIPAPDAAENAAAQNRAKKRKGGGQSGVLDGADRVRVREVKPLHSVKAHSSNVSGLAWGYRGDPASSSAPTTLITGSWDHGLKVYDAARMDCTLTLNGGRVVTSLGRCSNSNVVATAGPDHTVLLWDMRTNGEKSGSFGEGVGKTDKSFRQSHKAWVSSVRWSLTDPFVLASTSHDGTLKVWDIRSSLPLHTVRAVNDKREKALCVAFGDGVIYSGGSDCVVKQFACQV